MLDCAQTKYVTLYYICLKTLPYNHASKLLELNFISPYKMKEAINEIIIIVQYFLSFEFMGIIFPPGNLSLLLFPFLSRLLKTET